MSEIEKESLKRVSILIDEANYQLLKELATADSRPVANYLRLLIQQEHSKLQKN